MGITGLLPFLKEAQREVNVNSFRGRKVAVDAYCWLHKGAYSCAMQLVMKTEKVEKLPFIRYCMKRVNMLRHNDITPIMVFDGGYLPTKANTEKERRERRQAYLTKGKELLKDGKKSEAVDCFQKSVDVSHEMALALIKDCRRIGVECIVAPYEADAQLAYLEKEGIVDLVITEDSDLLVFGCKRVLFKMDDAGNGKLIDLERDSLGKANKNLIGFTQDSFRQMCILSGCDYLVSVPGIGLGKATKLMKKYGQNPQRVIRGLRLESTQVPKDYDVNFKKAEWTFLYQLVFDPRSQQQVRLNPLPDDVDPKELEFAGIELQSPRKVVHMARGNIDPISLRVMDDYSPAKAPPPKSQSWGGSAMGTTAGRQYPLSIQAKLPLTSSSKSKGQFKPPKQSRPRDETDSSMDDEQLLSIYDDGESSTMESTGSSGADKMSSGGWLSKRRKLNTSEADRSCTESTIVSRYFSSTLTKDDRVEQTPEGEGSVVATKTARKLQLDPEDDAMIREEGENISSHSSPLDESMRSPGPHCRSPFHKRPQAMTSYFQTDTEITARKQLFPSVRNSGCLDRLRYTKSSTKVGGKNPFTLLDQSQKFVGGTDTENKKCFLLTKNSQEADLCAQDNLKLPPQTDCIVIDLDQEKDAEPFSQSTIAETCASGGGDKSSSFSYMTSKDFITAHPCTQGQPSVDEKPTVLHRSQSVTESMLPSARVRRTSPPLADLMGNTPLNNRRGSVTSSVNSTNSKMSSSRRGNKQKHLGLSRRSSNFNNPKPADSTFRQTTLLSSLNLGYARRPQM